MYPLPEQPEPKTATLRPLPNVDAAGPVPLAAPLPDMLSAPLPAGPLTTGPLPTEPLTTGPLPAEPPDHGTPARRRAPDHRAPDRAGGRRTAGRAARGGHAADCAGDAARCPRPGVPGPGSPHGPGVRDARRGRAAGPRIRADMEGLRSRAEAASSWLASSQQCSRLINREGVVPVSTRMSPGDLAFLAEAQGAGPSVHRARGPPHRPAPATGRGRHHHRPEQSYPALPELHVALALPHIRHPGRGGGPAAVRLTRP